MRIFVDELKNIQRVIPDDSSDTPVGLFEIYCPNIKTKLDKTVTIARHKHDSAGNTLHRDDKGQETVNRFDGFKENDVVFEEIKHTRSVGLAEAPSEWTLEDILNEKYKLLAKGKNFWFDEFVSDSVIDKSNSIANLGLFSISLPFGGVFQSIPIKISKKVKSIVLNIEGNDGLNTLLSVDGVNFAETSPGVVKLEKQADTFILKLTNNQEGVIARIKAVSIFY